MQRVWSQSVVRSHIWAKLNAYQRRQILISFSFQTLSQNFINLIFSSAEWTVSFRQDGFGRWPKHLRCCFDKLSFKKGIHEKIEFEVSDQQKRDTKTVSFWDSSAVDFIDLEILKTFPNLNGLTFHDGNIPILKNIFTVDLKMIQYLGLVQNKIKNLEPHVFDELVELKWIDLAGNEIEEILHPIFAKNKKLEYVDLSFNKIHTLHPNLFDGLPRLEKVEFFWRKNIKMLNVELKPHFDNYSQKYGSPKSELLCSDSQNICGLLLENYKIFRDQNCDLTLELAGGKTLSAHKTILMGKLLSFDPPYLSLINLLSFSSAQSRIR
jgi:hypothetical protein